MAATGTVTINIVGDSSRLRGALGDAESGMSSFQTKMDQIGQKLMGFGRSMTVGVTLPIVGAFALATKAAADEQQEIAKLNQALENSTQFTDKQREAVEKQITSWQNATGIADGKLRPALSNLVVAGMDWDQAQRTMSTAMDIATAKGLPLETVTKALGRAYLGNTASLARLGIATKDAEGNTLSFDQVMKNAAATMGGSAARAADTAAGRMSILKARFQDSMEELGNNLLPILEKIIGVISKVANKFNSLSPGLQQLIVYAGLAVAAIGPLATVIGGLATIIGAVSLPVLAIVAAIAAVAAAAVLLWIKWDEVWNWIKDHPAIAVIVSMLAAPIAMFVLIVGALKMLYENWGSIWPTIQAVLEAVWGVLQGIFGAMDGVIRAVGDAAKWAYDRFQEAWPTIQAIAEGVWAVVSGIFDAFVAVVTAIGSAAKWVWDRFQEAWPVVQSLITTVWDVISGPLHTFASIVSAIGGATQWVMERAQEAWPIVQSAIQTAWGIVEVPLNALSEVLGAIVGGLSWVVNQAGNAWDAFKSGVSSMWGAVEGPLSSLASLLGRIVDAARSAKNAIDKIPSLPGGGWIPDLTPGFDVPFVPGFDVPFVPRFDTGGIIPGTMGAAVPMIGHAGEVVLNEGQATRLLWSLANGGSSRPGGGDVTVVIVDNIDQALAYIPEQARAKAQAAFLTARV